MIIGYTMASGPGRTDLLLASLAERLAVSGARLCGTVQINSDNPDRHGCDMDVKVLPSGPIIRISQSLGREARGCRLDPAALEKAVALARLEIEHGADLLIVNKFGKHEAAGGGYRELIADALALNIPVLVGLSHLNEAAFHEFTGGAGESLAPELQVLLNWCARAGIAGLRLAELQEAPLREVPIK